jgi:sugar phosphate isomerase/epimerase
MKQSTRRKFLSLSATMAATSFVCRKGWGAPAGELVYGVQMYMLRQQAATDLPGVFRAIHHAGFVQVELYPIAYRETPAALRNMIIDAGLETPVSGHFDYVGLESKLDYAQQLGLKYVVCPMLPVEQWNSLEGFRAAAELFNKVGRGAHERGMQFVFHNHDYEFKPIENSNGFMVLMERTDPALVKLELDCYWLTQAGQDPLEFLRRHADRTVLLHLKDRTADAPVSYVLDASAEHFTELGLGTINWPAILAQGRKQGIRYAFLDQDNTAGPIPASMRVSREYLRSIGR